MFFFTVVPSLGYNLCFFSWGSTPGYETTCFSGIFFTWFYVGSTQITSTIYVKNQRSTPSSTLMMCDVFDETSCLSGAVQSDRFTPNICDASFLPNPKRVSLW